MRIKLASQRLKFKWKSKSQFRLNLIILIVIIIFSKVYSVPSFYELINLHSTDGLLDNIIKVLFGFVGTIIAMYYLSKDIADVTRNHFDFSTLATEPNFVKDMSVINKSRLDFKNLIELYAGRSRIYAFIDDLDRCEFSKIIELINAKNFMISDKANICFIMGMDEYLKKLLESIQEKAKIECKQLIGSPIAEFACTVNREVQKWKISNQEEMTQNVENLACKLEEKISDQPKNQNILNKIEQMKNERDLVKQYEILAQIIPLIRNIEVVPVDDLMEKIENNNKLELEEIRKISKKIENVEYYVKPGVRGDIILHIGPMTPYGGAECILTIPLKGVSYAEIKKELEKISGKRINKLSMLPEKVAKIVEEFLDKNGMKDLLNKLR